MHIKKLPNLVFLEKLLQSDSSIEIKTAGITSIDKNWMIPERTLPDHLIYFIANGSMEASLNKNNFKLKEGNLLWVQPGITQKFWLNPNQIETKVYFVRFHIKLEQEFLAMENQFLLMDDFYHLQNHFHDFLIQQGEISIVSSFLHKAYLSIILCDVLREPQKKNNLKIGLKRFQIRQIQRYVQKNIQKRFTSLDLAKELKLNNDYFTRLFKKTFDQSPREYIKQERLRRASALLVESNMNISELSHFLGYQDVYQFSQQFKKCYGKSPNNYRKNH